MNDDALLEPLKAYNDLYKNLHKENSEKYFDELVSKAGTKVEENKSTVKNYYSTIDSLNNIKKSLGNQRALRGFLIFLMIVFVIGLGVLTFLSFSQKTAIPFFVGFISIVGAAGLIFGGVSLIRKVINKKISELTKKRDELQAKADALLKEAWAQMASLNALYDWGIPGQIISQTVPIIQMDKNFDPEKYQYLHEKYGFEENNDENASTYFVQSGSILGNPFLISRYYIQSWFNKTYTGSITIHWTTTERTSDGKTRTVHHSQTLTASVSKPCPRYDYDTRLIYGNEAAPDLTFSRKPSGVSGMDDKQIDKFVKKGVKKIDKKAKKAVGNNQSFTRIDNAEFEVLFGGIDRDHEVQFRLLYTPLAQKNLINLIRTPEPYGDDFYQFKEKMMNYVVSSHSQTFDYIATPVKFIGFDYEKAKQYFVEYNCEYFKAFYFDMAPLLSVPLYQQHKAREYIYEEKYQSNITAYEHESVANSFDINLLKSPNSKTPNILKTTFEKKDGAADTVRITAHSFNALRRVTYVNKLGGDGRIHTIPVYWIEYIPVEQYTYMAIENKDSSRFEFNNMKQNSAFTSAMSRFSLGNAYIFERGLFATLLARQINIADVTGINSIYAGTSTMPEITKMAIDPKILALKLLEEQDEVNNIDASNNNNEADNVLNDTNADTKEVEYSEADEPQSTDNNVDDDDDDDDEE